MDGLGGTGGSKRPRPVEGPGQQGEPASPSKKQKINKLDPKCIKRSYPDRNVSKSGLQASEGRKEGAEIQQTALVSVRANQALQQAQKILSDTSSGELSNDLVKAIRASIGNDKKTVIGIVKIFLLKGFYENNKELLNKDYKELRNNIEQLNEDYRLQRKRIKLLNIDFNELKKSIELLNKDYNDLLDNIELLDKDYNDLKENVELSNLDDKEFKENIELATKSFEDLQNEIKDLNQEYKDLVDENFSVVLTALMKSFKNLEDADFVSFINSMNGEQLDELIIYKYRYVSS